ncbi:hypothetical protein [Ideonella paludis]
MMMTIRQLGPVAAAAALAVTLPVLAASTPATLGAARLLWRAMTV